MSLQQVDGNAQVPNVHRHPVAGGWFVESVNSPRAEVIRDLAREAQQATNARSDIVLLLGGIVRSDRDEHAEVIRELATMSDVWTQVLAFGPDAKAFVMRAKSADISVKAYDDRYELRDVIIAEWATHNVPLIAAAGSRGPNLSWAVDDALGTLLSLESTGVADRSSRVSTSSAEFDLVSGFGAVAVAASSSKKDLVFPSTVAGMGLVAVGSELLNSEVLTTVMLPAPVRTIGDGAFANCSSLSTVILPRSLKYIGEGAFENDVALTRVHIPENVSTIGRRSFAGCANLKEVALPRGLVSIADDAFDGCHSDLRFVVQEGSTAADWAGSRAEKSANGINPSDRHFETRRISHDGIDYRVLPGGELEATKSSIALYGKVSLPAQIQGHPLKGIGYSFVGSGSQITELELPASVAWVSSHAISSNAALRRVSALRNLQSLGKGVAVRRLVSFNPKVTRDVDTVRLTLRMACGFLGLEVPRSLEHHADMPYTTLSGSIPTSKAGSLHFENSEKLTPAVVDRLLARGVNAFVTDHPIRDGNGTVLPYVRHSQPHSAHEKLCEWIASQRNAKTIAITGSVGKTSTKEVIQRVSSSARMTHYSRGNQNGVTRVTENIQKVADKTEVYIQETGAVTTGYVERSAKMLRADAFVITNIGLNHVGYYEGNQDLLLADKLSHDKYMPEHGVAFINFDDPKLRLVRLQHRMITFGVDSRDTDYWAEDINQSDGELTFTIVEAATGIRTESIVYSFGRHNVGNAVVAFAIGRWLGIPRSKILMGIASYEGSGLRQNMLELGGRRVLVDCYNASEAAIGSTAETLHSLSVGPSGRRIYVVADIDNKLGDVTEEVHRRVGVNLAGQNGIDRFYLFGHHASWIAEELRARGRDVVATVDRDVLHAELQADLKQDDVVAFKGGQQMALSITIDRLFGTAFVLVDSDVLERRGTSLVEDDVTYRIIDEYGSEMRKVQPDSARVELDIVSSVRSQPMYMVGAYSCSRTSLKRVRIPAPVRTIATAAFYQARSLEEVALPQSLLNIGRSAFNGCWSLRDLEVPEGVTTIGRRAFFGCRNLERLVIPVSVRTIDKEAFGQCLNLTVVCPAGSFAEAHLRENWPNVAIESI